MNCAQRRELQYSVGEEAFAIIFISHCEKFTRLYTHTNVFFPNVSRNDTSVKA